jgi:hypothetical protein
MLETKTCSSQRVIFLVRVARWYIFKTKNPNLGKFLRVLQWKMLKYFMDIGSILQQIGLFYDHLVCFMVIWYMYFSPFWYVAPRKIWHPWILKRNVRSVQPQHPSGKCHFWTSITFSKNKWESSGKAKHEWAHLTKFTTVKKWITNFDNLTKVKK